MHVREIHGLIVYQDLTQLNMMSVTDGDVIEEISNDTYIRRKTAVILIENSQFLRVSLEEYSIQRLGIGCNGRENQSV